MKFKKIVKITKGISDVYDLNVKRNHTFIYDGTVLHNCDFHGQILCSFGIRGNKDSWNSSYTIQPGERIAQAMFTPKIQVKDGVIVSEFTKISERGSLGFGTTGKF